MTICFVTPEFVTEEFVFDGGLANYLFRVSLGLIELGHKPLVIVTSYQDEIISYRKITVHRVNVKQLQGSISIKCLYQSFVLNKYLEKLTRRQTIDIVQYTSFTGVGIYRLEFIPSVVRLSSYSPLLTKYFNIPNNADSQNVNYIESTSIKNADGVFGPSQLIVDEISDKEKIKINVIESPFVYDASELDYSLSNKLLGKKYLLFFGTLGILKGIKTIADILNDLFSIHNDLFFVFLGKDAGFNGHKMMDYVYENAGSYRNRIYYFDKMNHEKLYPFIINAFAVVLPSRMDNFPNTCIEAMAHGKIVIGTKNTGFDQLIEDGVNGYLCEKDNSQELLQTIENVLSLSEEDIQYLKTNALKRIDLLKPHYVVKELVDFFSEVIKKHRKYGSIPVVPKDEINSFLWGNILDSDKKNIENINTIRYQEAIIKSLYGSNKYKIGDLIFKPISYIKQVLKWLK